MLFGGIFQFIQILIELSVSKQWRPCSTASDLGFHCLSRSQKKTLGLYASINTQPGEQAKLDVLFFLSVHQHVQPLFIYVSRECSGEPTLMLRLARTFAADRCDKYMYTTASVYVLQKHITRVSNALDLNYVEKANQSILVSIFFRFMNPMR